MNAKEIFRVRVLLPSACIALLPIGAAAVIVRNLGWLIGRFIESDEGATYDFARIFEQTSDAELRFFVILPLLFGAIFGAVEIFAFSRVKRRGLRVVLRIVLFFLLFVASFLCSLLLCEVNGIRLCDLLGKLLPLIDKL